MHRVIEKLDFDGRFDLLRVDGVEIGFVLREPWDMDDGVVLLMGNTFSGHTVTAESLELLVDSLLMKAAEVRRYDAAA